MLPFALSIFTGAFLLFQVQPLIGKYILPWFGGGPGVWTTCLLFFQTLLLGGYAYAHFLSTRLKPSKQAVVHIVLLLLSLAFLPIAPSESWKPAVSDSPTWHILILLCGTIGLPYFVLSSTGPLMQQWFSVTNPGVSPYRLYALSNVGSLLALLSYPLFFEVQFARHVQAIMWSVGLVVFVLFCGFCALRLRKYAREQALDTQSPTVDETQTAEAEKPKGMDKLLWVTLPAIASVLLLATTNKLSQEVAVIPFLWVLPLSLYLLSFIISFDHARWYHRPTFVALLVVSVAVVFQIIPAGNDAPMLLQIIGYNVALFIACMVCHGELYQLKPPPRSLTSYFLLISAGGALGGFFVAIIAPAIFNDYRELQIGLWLLSYALGVVCFRHQSKALAVGAGIGLLLAAVVMPWMHTFFDDGTSFKAELITFFKNYGWWVAVAGGFFATCVLDFQKTERGQWHPRVAGFMMLLCLALGLIVVIQWPNKSSVPILSSSRNFYGTLKVFNYYPNDPEDNYHLLLHGATTHGLQFTKPERSVIASSYYGENSGVGLGIDNLPTGPRRLGLVGLGTGSLSVYARAGDYLRIYEINSAVEKLAREQFTYLENSPAKIDVVMGDARLVMEREVAENQGQKFDFLALDAFSSDAIPVHLLTKEAFELYLKQITENGVIAVHVSNRYLNLRPVVEKLAENFGMHATVIYDDDSPEWWLYATTWILVTKNKAYLEQPAIADRAEEPAKTKRPAPLWTDDYASLYSILKRKGGDDEE